MLRPSKRLLKVSDDDDDDHDGSDDGGDDGGDNNYDDDERVLLPPSKRLLKLLEQAGTMRLMPRRHLLMELLSLPMELQLRPTARPDMPDR